MQRRETYMSMCSTKCQVLMLLPSTHRQRPSVWGSGTIRTFPLICGSGLMQPHGFPCWLKQAPGSHAQPS